VEVVARIEGLSYWYPGASTPSLRSLDLELEAGLVLVAGVSGGGKSTLLRLLNGLVPQFHGGRISGSAMVAGLDPLRTPIPRLAGRVGLVFQDVETQSVYGTVEREVAFGLENQAMPRAEMHDRVHEALATLSIEGMRPVQQTVIWPTPIKRCTAFTNPAASALANSAQAAPASNGWITLCGRCRIVDRHGKVHSLARIEIQAQGYIPDVYVRFEHPVADQELCDDETVIGEIFDKLRAIGYAGPGFGRAELGMQGRDWIVLEPNKTFKAFVIHRFGWRDLDQQAETG